MHVLPMLAVALLLASATTAQSSEPPKTAGQAAKTRTLRGHVLDARLQPLANAEVRAGTAAQLDAATLAPATTTDASGRFTVTVPAGALPCVRVSAAGATTAVRDPTPDDAWYGWDPGFAMRVQSEHLPTLVLAPARPVQGRVRDQEGKPVAGALIEAEDLLTSWTWYHPWRLRETTHTEPSGIFALRGTPPQALRLRVSAPGFYTRSLAPVDAGSPLDVSLAPSGFLAGTVVDSAGKPIAARVTVNYEGYPPEQLHTAADGAFRTTLRHPTHCRVQATTGAAGNADEAAAIAAAGFGPAMRAFGWLPPPNVPTGESEVITAPQKDLRITVALPAPPDVALRVSAVDETGKKIADFRAAVSWNGSEQPESLVLQYLAAQGVASADGIATLLPPQNDRGEEHSGFVAVSSHGRATTVTKAAWQPTGEGANVDLQVTLTPGIEVSGTVQDADGKPFPGASVWASRAQPGRPDAMGDPRLDAVHCAADGTFRIGSLGEGTWYCQASQVAGGPATTPRRVRIGKEPVPTLTLKLPRLRDAKGRVDGAVPPGAMLMLNDGKVAQFAFGQEHVFGQPLPLDGEGRFLIRSTTEGGKGFTLTVPQSPRSGSQLALNCTGIRVTQEEGEFTVSPRQRLGQLRGRVKCDKTQVPPQRLVVCSGPKEESQPLRSVQEVLCPVNLDGTWQLTLPTGVRLMRVRDALTSMPLGDDVECNVEADQEKTLDLILAAGELRLRLQGEDDGEGGPGVQLQMLPTDQELDAWWMFANQRGGLDLRDTTGDVTIYLKAGPTSLHLVRGNLDDVRPPMAAFFGGTPTSEVLEEIEVKAGKLHEVTLKIPRRPSLRR